MKLCPKCNLNLIEDNENYCSLCDKTTLEKNGGGGNGKARTAYFQEEFIFTSEKAFYRGKSGFQAYNSKQEKVGLVFMCDDPRTPAYEHCELCIYDRYQNQYGEWHRIQSHGGRIKWSKLCEILKQKTKHKVFID